MPLIEFLRQRGKRFISSDILKAGPVLNLREGEQIIATYTSAADKMKIFSACIHEGIEDGDAVIYSYPDEEGRTISCLLYTSDAADE